MAKTKSEPLVYAPFFCSLWCVHVAEDKEDVQSTIGDAQAGTGNAPEDDTFKLRCLKSYVKYITALSPSKGISYLVLSHRYCIYSALTHHSIRIVLVLCNAFKWLGFLIF